MDPSDFRSEKISASIAFGSLRLSCVRRVLLTVSHPHYYANVTPCRMPPGLSPPVAYAQTLIKRLALGIAGIVLYCSSATLPSFLHSFKELVQDAGS
jgi:hypothetical protein